MLSRCFLASLVSSKSAIIWIIVFLYIICLFFLFGFQWCGASWQRLLCVYFAWCYCNIYICKFLSWKSRCGHFWPLFFKCSSVCATFSLSHPSCITIRLVSEHLTSLKSSWDSVHCVFNVFSFCSYSWVCLSIYLLSIFYHLCLDSISFILLFAMSFSGLQFPFGPFLLCFSAEIYYFSPEVHIHWSHVLF